jgi:hypothetical protein
MFNAESYVEPVHGSENGEACPVCDRSYQTIQGLRIHVSRAHPEIDRKAMFGPGIAPGTKADRPPKGTAKPSSLYKQLEVSFTFAAQMASMVDPICGGAALRQVPTIARAWDNWAKTNPTVHRFLSSMVASSGPIEVAIATLPVAFVIVAHHGPNRAQFEAAVTGTPPPSSGPTIDAEEVYVGNGQVYTDDRTAYDPAQPVDPAYTYAPTGTADTY